jgi:hypothetical protein
LYVWALAEGLEFVHSLMARGSDYDSGSSIEPTDATGDLTGLAWTTLQTLLESLDGRGQAWVSNVAILDTLARRADFPGLNRSWLGWFCVRIDW